MAYQPQYCQQHSNHTRGRPETRHTAKQHHQRETGDVVTTTATKHGRPGPYGPPNNPRRADHWRTNTGERTPRTRHALVATHPLLDRPAAATLRTHQEDNENNAQLHRRGLHNGLPIKLLAEQRPDNEQTTRKPANTQLAKHAKV